ncbi:hypothetical protein ABK040_005061 [Willaertia magna]
MKSGNVDPPSDFIKFIYEYLSDTQQKTNMMFKRLQENQVLLINKLNQLSLDVEYLKNDVRLESSTANHVEFYQSLEESELIKKVKFPDWLDLTEKEPVEIQYITEEVGSNESKIMQVFADIINNKQCIVKYTSEVFDSIKPYLFTLLPKTLDVDKLIRKGKNIGILPLCLGFIEGKCLFDNSNKRKVEKLTTEDKGQALFYACKVLEQFRPLKHCMVALTNYHQIIFMKAVRRYDGIYYIESDPITLFDYNSNNNNYSSDGWAYLCSMLKKCVDESHIVLPKIEDIEPLSLTKLNVVEFLGRGNTSIVYGIDAIQSGCFSNKKIALKLFYKHKEKSVDHECKIIDILKEKGIKNVPEVIKKTETFVLLKRYNKLASPSPQQANQLIDALEEIHRLGFMHRDIRPDNIMQDDDGTVILIDWSFSLTKEEAKSGCGFTGTIAFSSDRYLDESSEYRETDDCESLLKYLYYWDNAKLRKRLYNLREFTEQQKRYHTSRIWKDVEDVPFVKALELIRNDSNPYDALRTFVKECYELNKVVNEM